MLLIFDVMAILSFPAFAAHMTPSTHIHTTPTTNNNNSSNTTTTYNNNGSDGETRIFRSFARFLYVLCQWNDVFGTLTYPATATPINNTTTTTNNNNNNNNKVISGNSDPIYV